MLIGENVECLFCTGYKHADKHRQWIDEQRLESVINYVCLMSSFTSSVNCIVYMHYM